MYTDTVALQGQTCSFLACKTRSLLNTWERGLREQLGFLALSLKDRSQALPGQIPCVSVL